MSNQLTIEVIEYRTAKSTGAMTYALYVYDSYADSIIAPHDSYEALIEYFPTRLDILKHIAETDRFNDTIRVEGTEVTMDTVSHISFDGFPPEYEADDSFTIKED